MSYENGRQKTLFRILKKLMPFKQRFRVAPLHVDGNHISEPVEARQCWQAHVAELLGEKNLTPI